jgi:hypothetical protein
MVGLVLAMVVFSGLILGIFVASFGFQRVVA